MLWFGSILGFWLSLLRYLGQAVNSDEDGMENFDKNGKVWGLFFVSECWGSVGEVGTSVTCGRCRLGLEGIVPHCMGGSLWFLPVPVGGAQLSGRTLESGVVPPAANQNPYRGWTSCVR